MKKRFLATKFAMVMTVSMLLVGCGSGSNDSAADNTTNEAVEQQETVSEATTETESENTEVATESESADVSAAGCEFSSVIIDEVDMATFNPDNEYYIDYDMLRNDKYKLELVCNMASSLSIDEIVAFYQDQADRNKMSMESEGGPTIESTYEAVTIDDYTCIKCTTFYSFNNDTLVSYLLPLKDTNGIYTNYIIRFSWADMDTYASFTEEDVLAAIELLY